MAENFERPGWPGDADNRAANTESAAPQTGAKTEASVSAEPKEALARTPLRIAACCGEPSDSVVLRSDGVGEAASQIRAIRARVLSRSKEKRPQVITVTSACRHEGKSTIAINLGLALSEVAAGRVVVVDGDFLAPTVHLFANVEPKSGLIDVLHDEGRLAGHVYETKMASCDIVPGVSRGDRNGAEAMLALKCEDLMAELRRYYAFVVVDTPPVFASSHARTFARHSDGVLLVVRLEQTPREVVQRAASELEASGAKIIGGVFTDRKHHIPNLIYRFLGSTPSHYYSYYSKQRRHKP